MAQRLINFRDFRERLGGIAPSRMYELLAAKLVPHPLRIGRRNFWIEAEVDAWIEALAAKRDQGEPVIPVMRRSRPRPMTAREAKQIAEGQALARQLAEARR